MAKEDVSNAEELRKNLVGMRRKAIADSLGNFSEQGRSPVDQVKYVVFLQEAIDALDRAIEDEKKALPSVYNERGLLGS